MTKTEYLLKSNEIAFLYFDGKYGCNLFPSTVSEIYNRRLQTGRCNINISKEKPQFYL